MCISVNSGALKLTFLSLNSDFYVNRIILHSYSTEYYDDNKYWIYYSMLKNEKKHMSKNDSKSCHVHEDDLMNFFTLRKSSILNILKI